MQSKNIKILFNLSLVFFFIGRGQLWRTIYAGELLHSLVDNARGWAVEKGRKNIFPVYYRRQAIGFRCLNNLPACGGDGGSDVQPLGLYTNKRVCAAITSPLPKSPCKKTLRIKRGVDKK